MKQYKRMLMVYPKFEASYWGMQYSLPIIRRKSLMPPLGLLTIAGLTPDTYEIRLVDMNTTPLTAEDIAWADMVLFSAMLVQKVALMKAAERCREAGKLVVFGGPYPTACPEECHPYCDVMVLDEGEITWPMFLADIQTGRYRSIYRSPEKPDITQTPVPRFDLLNTSDYVSIPIQFSRGCPFLCEFCDIIVLFGRRPRTKTPAQLLKELDALMATGYRGQVFIVDDNFIGNKKKVMELLPELTKWNREHGNPFSYGTEASVNLADDPKLLSAMVEANFIFVFLGIETPSADSLKETRKHQNVNGSLLERVVKIQNAGLVVYGGFIVGFDNDGPDIFDRQMEFINESAIANSMIGPLMALPGTPLYTRMQQEGRLLEATDYGNWYESGYTNIVTKLPRRELLIGHKRIVETIYDPPNYFERTLRSFQRLPRGRTRGDRWRQFTWLVKTQLSRSGGGSDAKKPSPFRVLKGLIDFYRSFPLEFRVHLRKFLLDVLRACPEQLPRSLSFICMGYHCYEYTKSYTIPKIDEALALPEPQLQTVAAKPAQPKTALYDVDQLVGAGRN
ncbi:MAG: B12-binding domain-containing radical SAM protein [Acidobacteriaceae bacterium]|nr:B12-binding domain-containing radical SAM protein [Acidobacteriaceae bacterium]